MRKVSLLGSLLLAAAMQVVGAPVVGVLNIFGDVQVTAPGGVGNIDFLPVGGTGGVFGVTTADSQEGDFVPLAFTSGDIKDLNQAVHPVGVPFLLSDFITFDADPDIRFDLRLINPGTSGAAGCFVGPAAGQQCTPPGSPFNLSNVTAGSSTASFQLSGDIRRVSTGELTPYNMIFTTQFIDQNYQQLLNTITTGGAVRASFSAEAAAIPEPGSMTLFAAGTALLAGLSIRRKRRSRLPTLASLIPNLFKA